MSEEGSEESGESEPQSLLEEVMGGLGLPARETNALKEGAARLAAENPEEAERTARSMRGALDSISEIARAHRARQEAAADD